MKQPYIAFVYAWMLAISVSPALEIYVAPGGDDAHPGTLSEPLATLGGARTRVRAHLGQAIRPADPVTVYLRGGPYHLSEGFRLGAEDSGTATAPVTYAAYPNETPRLLGGRILAGPVPVTDPALLDRLPPEARSGVRKYDLKALGIDDYGTFSQRGFAARGAAALELFYNARPMTLARWPNRGWMTIQSLPDGKDGQRITYAGDRPARWHGAPDAWLFGYWFHGWADRYVPVTAVDPASQTLSLDYRHPYGLRQGQRFFALNLLEELDTPGEWYLDRARGQLYFWPPDPDAKGEVLVSLLKGPLVEIQAGRHLRLEGLTLEATRADGLIIKEGRDVQITRCTLRNVGKSAVYVSGGERHRIAACEIYGCGEGGIGLNGGDRKSLNPAGHEAANNHIHHYSRWCRTYRPAISLNGVGNRAVNNLIHHAPHQAISFSGNDHLIARNRIHHVLLETDDAGAIYAGRDWSQRGTVIRENLFESCGPGFAPLPPAEAQREPHVTYVPLHRHGTNLIYLDDCYSGVTITGNILCDGGRALMVGGGRDNRMYNNLILRGEIGLWIDHRGVGWAKEHARDGGTWGIFKRLRQWKVDQPPYRDRYPELARILDEAPVEPRGNIAERNVFVQVKKWKSLQPLAAQHTQLKDNLVIEKAVGATLEEWIANVPQSDLDRIGFKPIPLDKMGPAREAVTPTVPVP